MTIEEKENNSARVLELLSEGYSIPGDMLFDLEIDEIPMLLAPLLPKIGLAGFFGTSDTGKSAFLRQLAMAVSSGDKDFLGFKLNLTHKKALYVTTEDDYLATTALIRKQSNYNREAVKNIRFLFDSNELADKLEEELGEEPVDLAVIDAYSDVFRGDMNQAASVRGFLTKFSEMANRHECLMIFLHHSGKGRQNSVPGKDNILGSQGFESKMRLVAELRADSNDGNLRHLCIVKGNYIKVDEKHKSFALRLNENMTFDNTGDRIPFDDLVPTDLRGAIHNPDIVNQVMRLSKSGLSTRQIEEELPSLGIQLGKSSVNRIVKENSETIDFGTAHVSRKEKREKVNDADNDESLLLG